MLIHSVSIISIHRASFQLSAMLVENDTDGITGMPTTVGGRDVVERAGLGASTHIVYPGSGREDA